MCPIEGCANRAWRRDSTPWDPHEPNQWETMASHFASVHFNQAFLPDQAKRHPGTLTIEHKKQAAAAQMVEEWEDEAETPGPAADAGHSRERSPRRSSSSTSPPDVDQSYAAFFADVEEACDSLSNGVLLLRRAMGRAKWRARPNATTA